MAISAALVKELRERTGSGMMECKKALVETDGDIEAAVALMRKRGAAKADKRAGRTAADGLVVLSASADGKRIAIAEVNCETDFVTKGDDFKAFAGDVTARALASDAADVEALSELPLHDGGSATIEEARKDLVAKIGENITVRRFSRLSTSDGLLCSYLHGTRIGVVVEIHGGDEVLGKDIAMHIAASRPEFVSADDVPAEQLSREREILIAQAANSGKPQNIIEKMVEGRLRKYVGEITLTGQPFVKDPDSSVGKLLQGAGATVKSFVRFEVGEGIEKKQENFAEEVMAQVRGE
jgi:elongation factor Ts